MSWPAIIIGWPAISTALVLCVAGLVRGKPGWLFVATAVAMPFSFYLVASPGFGRLGFVLPLLLIGAGIAIRNRRLGVAWVLVLPFAGLAAWLAFVVLTE